MTEQTPRERASAGTVSTGTVSAGTKVKLVLAWTLVSVPLVWGVLNTLDKAALLFR